MFMWLGFALVLGFALFGFAGSRSFGGENDSTTRTPTVEGDGAIDALKQRYVRGEIDIEEFERRAKRLYETEQMEPWGEPSTTGSTAVGSTQTGSSAGESNGNRPVRRPNRRGRGGCGR